MSSTQFHLSCHCRSFSGTLTLPAACLPLKSSLCHCTLCRRSSGLLFATFAVIPLPDFKPDCAGLTAFDTSTSITRWSCGTCGCSVWNDDRGGEEWEVATGCISGISRVEADQQDGFAHGSDANGGPGSPEGLGEGMELIDGILNRVQMWVGSTGDGGGALWVNGGRLGSGQRKIAERSSETLDDDTLSHTVSTAREQSHGKAELRLGLKCACGGIDLTVTRTDPTTKFEAGVDACWSCRKTSGFEITSWANIPTSCFSWSGTDRRPVTFEEPIFGPYRTSELMMRYFCRGCGVPAFCVKEGRDGWDVCTGLLEGDARLEDWLVWSRYGDKGVAYVEDAIDEGFVDGLVEGVKRDSNRGER